MPSEITKAKLVELLEEDDALEYMGRIRINTDMRLYYRSRIGAADDPKGYQVAYVVE